MEKDLSNYRKSYEKGELLFERTPSNPLKLYKDWFQYIDKCFPEEETNAMTISTIGKDGFPKNRVVLLKKYSDQGFIFYTNYNSEKGKAIQKNPNVCLSFFWQHAERQVIIKGKAEKISESTSDDYFNSRPRASQLGALASNQSEVINDRLVLELKHKELQIKYNGKEIPRPKHWGGYIVKPVSIEFWQGRANRLHDRVAYKLIDGKWNKKMISP